MFDSERKSQQQKTKVLQHLQEAALVASNANAIYFIDFQKFEDRNNLKLKKQKLFNFSKKRRLLLFLLLLVSLHLLPSSSTGEKREK